MTPEGLKKRYLEFLEAVKKMRGWEQQYEKYKIESDRRKMIRARHQVDEMLRQEIKQAGIQQAQIFRLDL
jgi:hypothetical protein